MKSSMRTFTLGLATCETLNKASTQPSAGSTLPTSVCGGLSCKPRPEPDLIDSRAWIFAIVAAGAALASI